ncbi:hypothetical protein JOQ06_001649, partial [Pogonophryne albipinna]
LPPVLLSKPPTLAQPAAASRIKAETKDKTMCLPVMTDLEGDCCDLPVRQIPWRSNMKPQTGSSGSHTIWPKKNPPEPG